MPLREGRVRRGSLYRFSGALLEEADLRTLQHKAVRLVVDLRGHGEGRSRLEQWAGQSGVEYHHEPIEPTEGELISWTSGMTAEEARRWLRVAYRHVVDHHGERFAAAIRRLSASLPGAFGCAAGKDRTGLLAALVQSLLGAPRREIIRHYVAAAPAVEFLGPVAARWRNGESLSVGSHQILSTHPETITVTLEYIDKRFGGTERYLLACGLDRTSLGALREALIIRGRR